MRSVDVAYHRVPMRVRQPKRTLLASAVARACLGTSVNLGLVVPALAQAAVQCAAQRRRQSEIEEIIVEDSAVDGLYRIDDSSLTKLTEPLRDVPQSIVTVPRELLDDRGITTLNEALRTVPGITLGAGEFSWQGNNPNIRGFNSRNDMFLDGMRDFGSYPRDPFNLETIEVLQGPSSMLFGRGSTGGVINQVTKRPHARAAHELELQWRQRRHAARRGRYLPAAAGLGLGRRGARQRDGA